MTYEQLQEKYASLGSFEQIFTYDGGIALYLNYHGEACFIVYRNSTELSGLYTAADEQLMWWLV